jgi:hypothetical protein
LKRDLERKIELLNNTIVVGRTADGVDGLLQLLLRSWGARQVVPLAQDREWRKALVAMGAPSDPKELKEWAKVQTGAAALGFDVFEARVDDWWLHHLVLQKLHMGLWLLGDHGVPIEVWGNGFVMRCGEDILMPDLYVGIPETERVHEYHYEGPAELIIEVLKSDTRDYDSEQQVAVYQKHATAEIWLIDLRKRRVEVIERQGNGSYNKRSESQSVQSSLLPLKLNIPELFSESQENPFAVTNPQVRDAKGRRARASGLGWSWQEAKPILSEPQAVDVDTFMTFVPEVKFEGSNARLEVGGGGWETSKDLVYLLLYHCGIRRALGLVPIQDYIAALSASEPYDPSSQSRR